MHISSAAAACQSLRKRSSGQVTILYVVTIVTLLACVSLVVDVTNLYLQFTRLQAATDSAALAGAAYLPTQTDNVQSTTRSYALSNGVTAAEIQSVIIAGDSNSLTVTTSRNVPAYFARVLGLTQFTVSASARAGVQPAGSNVTGVLPIGLDDTTTYRYGETVTLHGGDVGPGNWGGLALGCTGGSCYQDNLANGYSGQLSIGDVVPTEPGAKVGPTKHGIDDRIANGQAMDPAGTWNQHQLADPRAAVVPLATWGGVHGRETVPITGFAEVWITGVSGSDVSAVFIAQSISGAAAPGAPNAGALHVALLR